MNEIEISHYMDPLYKRKKKFTYFYSLKKIKRFLFFKYVI